jgi:transposase
MCEPPEVLESDYYVHVQTIHAQWGLRVQAEMLAYMDRTGLPARKVAKGGHGAPHKVPRSTLDRWWQHYQQWGETPIQTSKRPFVRVGRSSMDHGVGVRIVQLLNSDSSLYLDEIQGIIFSETGRRYHTSTIWRFMNRPEINFTLQVLTEKAVQQSQYEQMRYRTTLHTLGKDKDPSIFCFVDESSVGKQAARRRRGWSQRGAPAHKYALFDDDIAGNKHRYTLIGAVDINGFVQGGCDVVFRRVNKNNTATGTVDQERFLAYLEHVLLPHLGNYARGEPRSVVVMDNARIHKHPRVLQLIASVGAKLIWNAAYSPELNPIEACFHQYKSILRRNRDYFRTDLLGCHYYALSHAVTRTNMINYYGATAMRGCIPHLPAPKTKKTGMSVVMIAGAAILLDLL